jgi:hypothetical protein
MFPNNEGTAWTVSAKDHLVASPANVVAYCIVARQKNGSPIPSDVYKIVDQTSNVVAHPTQQVNLPEGFSVVGGGARTNSQGPGSLLFASNPTPGLDGWVGSAKDHIQSDPASITVWAIGLKDSFLSHAHLTVSVKTSTSAATNHPHLALVIPDFQMTGGGARVNWSSVGNLLTASFPQDRQTWVAEGKDHVLAERSTITAFAVGFQA